jgi:hypothetical protein
LFLAGRNSRTMAASGRDLDDFARFLGSPSHRSAVEPLLLAGQGDQLQAEDAPAEVAASRARKEKATAATGAVVSDDGAKLHLTPDVRFRLRMLAYQRGKKISAVANEVLDKALPRWNLERTV